MQNPSLTKDIARLLDDHLCRFPDSEISTAVIAWYNAEYAALGDIEPYEVCPPAEESGPSTLEDVVELIGAFVSGDNRRIASVSIRLICRQALRELTERTAPDI